MKAAQVASSGARVWGLGADNGTHIPAELSGVAGASQLQPNPVLGVCRVRHHSGRILGSGLPSRRRLPPQRHRRCARPPDNRLQGCFLTRSACVPAGVNGAILECRGKAAARGWRDSFERGKKRDLLQSLHVGARELHDWTWRFGQGTQCRPLVGMEHACIGVGPPPSFCFLASGHERGC